MREIFFFSLFAIFSTQAFSQLKTKSTKETDSEVIDSLEVAVAEEERLYKEDTTDYEYFYLPTEIEYVPGDDHPDILRDRLSCIQKNIRLVYNDKIHSFINYFTVRDREYTKLMMKRKNLYFPIFEKHLAKYGLPDELKYLSIIESGLNPRATSRVRAVGLWQFMAATGKYYGLDHNWYEDERMDPHKATDAACRYLRDLYRMFNDWELALAAYNTGPGNVKRAIRKSGYKNSFWEIYNHLPRETRSYVPQFVAIIYTMNYLDEHNFIYEGDEQLIHSDTLQVKKFFNFETFAKLTGTCIEDLQKLNPSIQRNAIPETGRTHIIRVPLSSKDLLQENRLAILDSVSKVGKVQLALLAKATSESTYGRDRNVYKVKSGDVLGAIAMRYNVRVADLKKWNNMRSDRINPGQRLNIWAKQSTAVVSSKSTATKKTFTPPTIPYSKTYTVQPGDTLWSISKKFDGLTLEKLQSLNKLSSNSKIQPGQKLIVGI
jgi:membrane-bound lytic murein transglycosylase D